MLSKITAAVFAFIIAAPAFCSVTYQFDFSNLSGVQNGSGQPFSITLTYNDYVTTTGLNALSGAPLSTTLGYPVAYAGTNTIGWWAFDDNNAGFLSNNSYSYAGNSFLATFGTSNITNYITQAGTYFGDVGGNAPFSFGGKVVLTVTDSHSVPESSALMLFVLGLGGVLLARRRAR